MFKVYSGFCPVADGTSGMSNMMVAPADLILAFGEPGESDRHKVSGEYTFHDEKSGVVFTMYDWKSTSLYDNSYPSPKAFWSFKSPLMINIGGNGKGNVEEFKQMIRQHVDWIKIHKPFEENVLQLSSETNNRLFTIIK